MIGAIHIYIDKLTSLSAPINGSPRVWLDDQLNSIVIEDAAKGDELLVLLAKAVAAKRREDAAQASAEAATETRVA